PPVVRERLVGLGHAIHVVLALPGAALLVHGVEDLARELLLHPLLAPLARVGDEVADRERAGAALRHLDGHLVVRAADAPAARLQHRRHRLDRLLEHLERRLARALADLIERAVDDPLRGRALAVAHHPVDHLRDQARVVDRIRVQRTNLNLCAAGHAYDPRFAPYLERACLRSATPEASSAARITLYRYPGRSLTRPPRTRTTECSCRLWPSPGMYVPTSIPFVSRTRAIFRSAEFGFFGVIVETRVQTPRFCG